jgi:hypothetical protein
MRFRHLALAACIAVLTAAVNVPASAVEPAPGSKNFEPPSAVPNYFSNEAGPFRGGAGAETTYSNPPSNQGPVVVSPDAPSRAAAAAPRRSVSRHAARANRHVRYARYAHTRGRGSRYAYARSSRSAHRVAHASARPAAHKTVAVRRQAAPTRSRPAARHAHTASR